MDGQEYVPVLCRIKRSEEDFCGRNDWVYEERASSSIFDGFHKIRRVYDISSHGTICCIPGAWGEFCIEYLFCLFAAILICFPVLLSTVLSFK